MPFGSPWFFDVVTVTSVLVVATTELIAGSWTPAVIVAAARSLLMLEIVTGTGLIPKVAGSLSAELVESNGVVDNAVFVVRQPSVHV